MLVFQHRKEDVTGIFALFLQTQKQVKLAKKTVTPMSYLAFAQITFPLKNT